MHARFKNIYVKIPANFVAGGIESLFQLVDVINNISGNCYIVFNDSAVKTVVPKYQHYNTKIALQVEDVRENLIIYPEIWTSQINDFKNLQKSIWWLSVDNNNHKFTEFNNHEIIHFYQSCYAENYLVRNGVQRHFPLFDYISKSYLYSDYDIRTKENIVCFNPFKGKRITDLIVSSNPGITFIPLINMDEEQIIETLKRSKVYIDFGHHPGRDRIPREAAHLGNCIITNKQGSAFYINDLPIPDEYKINTKKCTTKIVERIFLYLRKQPIEIKDASSQINNCLRSYENKIGDFDIYRSFIRGQENIMINQVKQFFYS